MPPTPTPEPDEIETARKMCAVSSYAEVEGKVNALGDASWADALLDIAEFRGVERKRIDVTGEVVLKPGRTRKELQRDMRVRLGYDPRTDDEYTSLPPTMVVERDLRW